jgi:hypothetical protein
MKQNVVKQFNRPPLMKQMYKFLLVTSLSNGKESDESAGFIYSRHTHESTQSDTKQHVQEGTSLSLPVMSQLYFYQ